MMLKNLYLYPFIYLIFFPNDKLNEMRWNTTDKNVIKIVPRDLFSLDKIFDDFDI
jgi:hypothetical protein